MMTDLERVIKYFDLQLRKYGRVLTLSELVTYTKKNKLVVSRRDLSNVRSRNKATAKHRRAGKKPQMFSSFHRPTLGILQVDLLFYPKRLKKYNKNSVGCFVAINPITGTLFVHGIRSKSRSEMEAAFNEMLYRGPFSKVTQVQSDFEAALTSKKFSKHIMDTFGIKLVYLKSHVQAWSAEKAIYSLKSKTAAVMERRDERFAWLSTMHEVVNAHNKEKILNTTYRRIDVTPANFMDFLAQKTRVKDPSLLMNIGRQEVEQGAHMEKAFRFKIGQKVLVTRAADSTIPKRDKTFRKISIEGYYSDRVFVIKEAAMTLNVISRKKVFVQTYRIAPASSPKRVLKGIFYVEELAPALFLSSQSSTSDSE